MLSPYATYQLPSRRSVRPSASTSPAAMAAVVAGSAPVRGSGGSNVPSPRPRCHHATAVGSAFHASRARAASARLMERAKTASGTPSPVRSTKTPTASLAAGASPDSSAWKRNPGGSCAGWFRKTRARSATRSGRPSPLRSTAATRAALTSPSPLCADASWKRIGGGAACAGCAVCPAAAPRRPAAHAASTTTRGVPRSPREAAAGGAGREPRPGM